MNKRLSKVTIYQLDYQKTTNLSFEIRFEASADNFLDLSRAVILMALNAPFSRNLKSPPPTTRIDLALEPKIASA